MTGSPEAQRRRNSDAVRLMFDCERRKDIDTWVSLWHPDGRQSFPWTDAVIAGRDTLRSIVQQKFATRSDIVIHDQVFALEDPAQVFAVVAVSMRVEGIVDPVETTIWCRFLFDEKGLIVEQQEAFDTAYAARAFKDEASA